MKNFKGKTIYNPSGKAQEYSYWACNFYVGCSNGCEYCYCKKGILAGVMGQEKPQLKKCFKDENHAIKTFEQEINKNLSELQKHGLFFSFTTDPMLFATISLTLLAVNECVKNNIPVKILTKCTDWLDPDKCHSNYEIMFPVFLTEKAKKLISIGFTYTGHDKLEHNANTNQERIEANKYLHDKIGLKTFASIEPIIDLESSFEMIKQTLGYCNLYKIGLLSGSKYPKQVLLNFIDNVNFVARGSKIYWKDSLLKIAGVDRSKLPSNCVTRDYNLFNQ